VTGRVPANGTLRRLKALVCLGWPVEQLAARSGVDVEWLLTRESGKKFTVPTEVAAAVSACYDELSMIVGPSPEVREYGQRRQWRPPLAWDDESIDDPAARPDRGRPRSTRSPAELVEDYEWLIGGGVSREDALAQLGVTVNAVHKAYRRARVAS